MERWVQHLLLLLCGGTLGSAACWAETAGRAIDPMGRADNIRAVALFKHRAVIEVGGNRAMLKVGESAGGCRLISASSREALVDCGAKRLSLTLDARVGTNYRQVQRAQIRINPDRRGQYAVRGTINGQPADLLVDTGASIVAMSSRDAARLGIQVGDDAPLMNIVTAQGRTQARGVSLGVLSIGGITVRNVDATVVAGEYPQQILLGMSFLRHVGMSDASGVLVLSER